MKATFRNRNWCIFVLIAVFGGCAAHPHMKEPTTDFYVPNLYATTNSGTVNWFSQSIRSISGSDVDEVWVIPRSSEEAAVAQHRPAFGILLANVHGGKTPLPLSHTDVKASVTGYLGSVDVRQQFENPYAEKIEAAYVFALPHNAAISEFIMTIGKRRIRGIIRERKDAQAIYEEAKRQGYRATLLTEASPNIFRQDVANIEPGREIDVNIKYFQTLNYRDGWFEFVFPMIAESQRNRADISLRVDVNAGAPIQELECKTHPITKTVLSPAHIVAELKHEDFVPHRDFVLRYQLADEQIQSSLLTHRDERGGFFSLMLCPPKEVGKLARQPAEFVFVLDSSVSMAGRPIEQAKAAVEHGLRLLQPGDSFQVIDASDPASQLSAKPVEATDENVQRGLNYLRSFGAGDDTTIVDGVRAALDFPHDPKRRRYVFFLTGGNVESEDEILGEIHGHVGDSRVFCLGIGGSVNRYLLERMARLGRGAGAYVGPGDDAVKTMGDFIEHFSRPALSNIKIDWGGMQASEAFPREAPDLFSGRAVILTGRFSGLTNSPIRVSGDVGGAPVQFEVPGDSSEVVSNDAVPNLWARMKIADLMDQSIYAPTPQLPYEMKQVALDYGILSPFTSFLTVDASEATEGN